MKRLRALVAAVTLVTCLWTTQAQATDYGSGAAGGPVGSTPRERDGAR